MYAHINNDVYNFIVKVASQVSDVIHRSFIIVTKSCDEVIELVKEYKEMGATTRKNLIEHSDKVLLINNAELPLDQLLSESTLFEIHDFHE